jgi:protein TonB
LALHVALFLIEFTGPRISLTVFNGFWSGQMAGAPSLNVVLTQAAPKLPVDGRSAVKQRTPVSVTGQENTRLSNIRRQKKPMAAPPSNFAPKVSVEAIEADELLWRGEEELRRAEEQAQNARVLAQAQAREEAEARRILEEQKQAEARPLELARERERLVQTKAREEAASIQRREEQKQAEESRRTEEQARNARVLAQAQAREGADARRIMEEQKQAEARTLQLARERERLAQAKAGEEAASIQRREEQKQAEELKRAEEQARNARILAQAQAREEADARRILEEQKQAEARTLELAWERERLVQAKAHEEAASIQRREEQKQAEELKRAEEQARTSKGLKEVREGLFSPPLMSAAEEAKARAESEEEDRRAVAMSAEALAPKGLKLPGANLPLLPLMSGATEMDQGRRGSIGGSYTRDVALVNYSAGWREKVERIGAISYPRLSKNRAAETLIATVSINSHGSLAGVRITKSSGYQDLDDAVRRIIELSGPFMAFPPALKRRFDIVEITNKWSFKEERPRLDARWDY